MRVKRYRRRPQPEAALTRPLRRFLMPASPHHRGASRKRAAACSEHAATPGRGFGARGFPEEIMTLHSRSAIWLLAAVAVLVAGTAGPATAAGGFPGPIPTACRQ